MKILLYSGGVDSLIAWYYLGFPLRLYVDLGARYSRWERASLLGNAPSRDSVMILDLKLWGVYERKDAWLPMRNMLLIMTAAAEGADTIYLVAQKGEQSVPDRKPEFFAQMSQMMTEQNKREIVVEPVFPDLDKSAMVGWYLKSGYDPQLLVLAYSCYSGWVHPCGQCAACWRKFIALEDNGIRLFGGSILRCRILRWGEEYYYNRLDEYSPERAKSMCRVMGWDMP